VSQRLGTGLVVGAIASTVLLLVTAFVPAPSPSFMVRATIVAVTTAAVGLSFLLAGLTAWRHWPTGKLGLLFTLVGYFWFLPAIAANVENSLAFTIGNLSQSFYQAPLTHLALAWPDGRLRSKFERAVVVTEYAWLFVYNTVGTMFWNPRTNGCSSSCPTNLLLVDGSNSVNHAISTVGIFPSLAISVVVLKLIVRHWQSARGWSRRAMKPLVGISFAVVAINILQNVENVTALPVSGYVLYEVGALVLLTGPALVVISLTRARTARTAVSTALIDLEPGPAPDRLRDALASALSDPALQLAIRLPDGLGYADTGQRHVDPARPEPGRATARLDEKGDAVLLYDEGLVHEPQLVRVLVTAASLAFEHSRLQAEVQAQLEQVHASRARIVEAGDAERRRLERDLHDGAQQRLVTLSLALAMASNRATGADPELSSLLEAASKEAHEALVELRELARGIHPAVLTQTGLTGAMQALAERSAVATTITAVPAGRLPAPIEATAYFVVSEALANVAKHAGANSAQVAIRHVGGHVLVEVSDNGTGGARIDAGSGLRGLADRVASVGGTLRIDSLPGCGTRLAADIPCP
jgi:signal transduction histidine kinase